MLRMARTLSRLGVAALLLGGAGAALAQPAGMPGPGGHGMRQGDAGPGGPGMRPADAGPKESPRVMRFIRIYDTDNNGTVSMVEIVAEEKRILGAADVDGDGALSVEEFRRRGRLIQSLGTTTLFDLLDVNGDRKITADELSAPSARWFARYDANGDGALSADELPAGHWGRHGKRGHHGR